MHMERHLPFIAHLFAFVFAMLQGQQAWAVWLPARQRWNPAGHLYILNALTEAELHVFPLTNGWTDVPSIGGMAARVFAMDEFVAISHDYA